MTSDVVTQPLEFCSKKCFSQMSSVLTIVAGVRAPQLQRRQRGNNFKGVIPPSLEARGNAISVTTGYVEGEIVTGAKAVTTAEGALLLALGGAEAAAGVPVAGGFFRDSVGGFAANIVEPDPILA